MKDPAKQTQSSRVGPMQLDCEAARKLGWTEEMIGEARGALGTLSRSYTAKVGITCIHCEAWNPRPKGGWPCEPERRDHSALGRELLAILRPPGCINQEDTDIRTEIIVFANRLLK